MRALITATQIARLAKVSRPVVTVWRTRHRDSAEPFPSPVPGEDRGSPVFDLDAVAQWLDVTGRGNNPEVLTDADRFRSPTEGTSVDGLLRTSALVIFRRHLALAPDESRTDLRSLVARLDPDDQWCRTELGASGTLADDLQAIESVAEASYGDGDLFAVVALEPLLSAWTPLIQTRVAVGTARLLGASLDALLTRAGPDAVLHDSAATSGPTLLAAGLDRHRIRLGTGDGPVQRFTRRLLLANDVALVDSPTESDSGSGTPYVEFLALPSPADLDTTPDAQLSHVMARAVRLRGRSTAVVLAPAALLTDRGAKGAGRLRDELIRSGRLRAIVRLPEGGLVTRPREHLALWVLSSEPATAAEHQVVHVADLSGTTWAAVASSGVVDDVVAVLDGLDVARGRAWSKLRPVRRSELLTAHGSLVRAPRAQGVSSRRGSDPVDDVRANEGLAAMNLDLVGRDDRPMADVTLAEAMERGWVRVLPGSRVDVAALPSGSTPVIGVRAGRIEQLPVRVDLLSLLAGTPAHTTAAGDIIFTWGRHPAAWYDRTGGSLVLAPARVLRVLPSAPLVAEAVAARIASAEPGTRWRSWTVTPLRDPGELASALASLRDAEERLMMDLSALRGLRGQLLEAVERHNFVVTRKDAHHGATP